MRSTPSAQSPILPYPHTPIPPHSHTPTPPHSHTPPWRAVLTRLLATILLAGVAVSQSSCATVDAVTGQNVYNIHTVQQDVEIGQQTIKSNIESAEQQGIAINQDPAKMAEIEEMVARLAEVSDLPDLPYNVTLFHTNIVNAAAAPGGSMLVFEGLYHRDMGLVHDNDELAAVMAHEIAHVNCRHSTEQLSKMLTAVIGVEVLAAILDNNDEEGWADALRAVFVVGSIFYIPIHSQTDEFEADRVGLFYMAKAGYDPRAAARIWKRVAEKQGQEHDSASIFSTHPSSWDRYEALEKMIPYAMEEYAAATGSYPPDYTPPDWYRQGAVEHFEWRQPAEEENH